MAAKLYKHGVSPTESVYQSKLLVLQVVLPWALTIAVRDQLHDQNRAMDVPHVDHMAEEK